MTLIVCNIWKQRQRKCRVDEPGILQLTVKTGDLFTKEQMKYVYNTTFTSTIVNTPYSFNLSVHVQMYKYTCNMKKEPFDN